ncbi:ribosome silencing factor [Cohnella lubricantis]|uniref:Ribosomal silencing factor RsfS n=1 Tax=Cohnella lubricantis TaxID=2163172 RepID=A0A841TBH6_9BACL|nr:ribosome silencing factor [Cohnella lubricantis]MBB6675781.1 ribosome silencing factor [Cohnella lubricantis]MBP2119856.1 ribosome-associated protein [Cohnella lubricantis]
MAVSSDKLLKAAIGAAEDKKAHELVALDLKGISLVADYFVICHGNSDTQVQSIATEIRKQAEELGCLVRLEGMDTARWVLVDMGDVVAHVFHREEREYYHLERLWSDAKAVTFA